MNISLFIICGDKSEMSSALKESCCRPLFESWNAEVVSVAEWASHSVDFWGHKQVEGPAFPPSLYLNDKELGSMIVSCSDNDELTALLRDNKERIRKNKGLGKLFEEKRT